MLELVCSGLIDYNDSSDVFTDWDWLRTDQEAFDLREFWEADLVTMTVDKIDVTSSAGGFANIPRSIQIGPTDNAAFSVNHLGTQLCCDMDAHEFGHNFGGEHNPEESPALPGNPPGFASYAFAFGHYSDVSEGAFTTIMVINRINYCTQFPLCSTPLLYSNADLTCPDCNGFPVGVPNARENAKAFALTTPVIAGYPDRPDFIFSSSFE